MKKDIHIRLLTLISFLYLTSLSYSQSISVSSFKLLDSDLTANTAGTMEQDQNGEVAALIKVVTTQTGFIFDGGALGIVKTKQTPGEVWVYVPRGSKKITIKHPQLGVLRDYFYPIAIEAARTYEMVLTTGTVETIVKQASDKQYLVIKVTPANAIVELDENYLPTSDGIAQKFVKLGTYEYRVQAQNYHTAAGKVSVDDPNNKKVLEINLQPAFGWIEIPASEDYNGAQVFIDNTLAGSIPMKSRNLASGEHNVKIVSPLYSPFSQSVVVKDNETTLVKPHLIANFSEVSISVDNDADIYINEENKGKGVWKGRLAYGSYVAEAKKDGYRSSVQNIEVSPSQDTYVINLAAPTPIFGEANITSTPTMADVYIGGKKYGQTPLFLPQLLVGNYDVVIKKEGYNDYYSAFSVVENKNTSLEALLDNKLAEVRLECNVEDAILFVDGNELGRISSIKSMAPGRHNIKVVAEGYKDYTATIDTESLKGFVYVIDMNPDYNSQTPPEEITYEEGMVEVRMECNVPYAVIYIDGKKYGNASNVKWLKPGIHSLSAVANGYMDYSAKIDTEVIKCFVYVITMKPRN